jgi:CRP-like cAMP-binding protein
MEAKVKFVSPLERALYLRTITSLRELDAKEMARVAQHTKERFFRKGAGIFTRGQPVESFHVVVEGSIGVRGAEHGDAAVGPPEALGFLSLLAQWPDGLEAVAEADTTTLEIDADDFYDMLEDSFVHVQLAIRNMAKSMLEERTEIAEGTYFAPAEGLLECPDRELDLVEKLLFLRRGTALQRANMDSLIEMSQGMVEHRFGAGEMLWKPGDAGGFVYLLVDGTVECRIEKNGRRFLAGPGYPLGNLESLAGEPRWYTATAEGPIVALRGETDAFLDILEDHFEMTMGFLAAMANGLIIAQSERRARETADVS